MSRTYSDPSYGSKKVLKFGRYTCGTRSAAILENISVFHPMTITKIYAIAACAGSGSTSAWAVDKNNTALTTMTFATNATAGTIVKGTLSTTAADMYCTAGDYLTLISGTATADPAQTAEVCIEYTESFDVSDN